jgi:hypothetical protein
LPLFLPLHAFFFAAEISSLLIDSLGNLLLFFHDYKLLFQLSVPQELHGAEVKLRLSSKRS